MGTPFHKICFSRTFSLYVLLLLQCSSRRLGREGPTQDCTPRPPGPPPRVIFVVAVYCVVLHQGLFCTAFQVVGFLLASGWCKQPSEDRRLGATDTHG